MLDIPNVDFTKSEEFPFISGDGYKVLCQYILDRYYYPDREMFSTGVNSNYIFVKTDYLQEFCNKNLPVLNKKKYYFNLITGNSDYPINGSDIHIKILNNKYLLQWYAQNAQFNHSKLKILPMGIENSVHLKKHNGIKGFLKEVYKRKLYLNINRKTLIRANYSLDNNKSERSKCQKLTGIQIDDKVSQYQFFINMLFTNFVISPEGNGMDCHRIWEALYCGCVPIIISHKWTQPFINNFPIIGIENWNSFRKENFTKDLYNCIMRDWDISKLEMSNFVKWW